MESQARSIVALIVLLSSSVNLWADVLTLEDSTVLVGIVRSDGTVQGAEGPIRVVVFESTTGARRTITGSRIVDLRLWQEFEPEYFRQRALAVSADAWFELGEWCESRGNRQEAEVCWRRAIECDPDHRQGRERMGFQLVDGAWSSTLGAESPDSDGVETKPARSAAEGVVSGHRTMKCDRCEARTLTAGLCYGCKAADGVAREGESARTSIGLGVAGAGRYGGSGRSTGTGRSRGTSSGRSTTRVVYRCRICGYTQSMPGYCPRRH